MPFKLLPRAVTLSGQQCTSVTMYVCMLMSTRVYFKLTTCIFNKDKYYERSEVLQRWCNNSRHIVCHVTWYTYKTHVLRRAYITVPISYEQSKPSGWQDSSVVECLLNDSEVCGSSLYHGILLWRWALHLHLASPAHISIMMLRPIKLGAKCTAGTNKQCCRELNPICRDGGSLYIYN